MMDDKVSIIVPVYNAAEYIKETICCVREQTYSNWELILVEDGSTDESGKIIEQLMDEYCDNRILFYHKENNGAAAARNYGLEHATGRFITYLDADDLWEPDKLEQQLSFVKEKEVVFCFTSYEFANINGERTGKIVHVPDTITYKQALQNTTIFTSTVMFDTDKIAKELLKMPLVKSEDTALWFQVLRNGYVAHGLDKNLVRYRRGGSSLSSNKVEALRRIWNLYRKTEHLSIPFSIHNFIFWAIHAVKRRL